MPDNGPMTETAYVDLRQRRLRERLQERKLALLLITKPANIFYMTRFRGTAGIVVFGASDGILMVDPRYTLQARAQASGVEVVEVKDGLLRAAGRSASKARGKRAGFEGGHLTWQEFEALRREAGPSVRWQPAGDLIEDLRVVKDALEIECIRQAGELTAAVFQEIAGKLRPGLAERDLGNDIEYGMRRRGAEGAAFETIVASGPRSALPHARASEKILRAGDLVILDMGAVVSGYAADMTRTLYLGTPGRRVRSLYDSVLNAQREAIERLKAGARAGEVDAAARRQLAKRKLDKLFTHSTGHGVGIEIHERPRLGKKEKTRICTDSVVTVEPGIYLEGFGGIRIEDTVRVGRELPEILTPAPQGPQGKDQWWIE